MTTFLIILSPALIFILMLVLIFAVISPMEMGYHRWHERYACQNCGRVTEHSSYPRRCPSCGSPLGRKAVVVRRILPFVWEQLDEDEARTGIKAKPTSLWSRLFGVTP